MTTMNREEQKQVLIDTANHIIHRDNTSPYSENLRELARIALAALEVEPIGFRCRRNDNLGDWSYVYHREPDDFERKHLVIEGIYAAPPAPVPLTEVQRAMLRDMDVEISAELEEEEEIYRDGIRKCIAALRYHHKRAETCSNGYTGSTLEEDTLKSINFLKRNNIAAMLQGAKPVSQTYKLNELSGNSPVTPDGWISCSDRMPGYPIEVLVAFKSDADGEPCLDTGVAILFPDGKWRGGGVFYVMNGDRKYQYRECVREVTHWMPLPEPPQEVNRG
ncbi:DUF551 domain-containing protein [Escherichia coli]|nr:DUF551 domain-containing protein [Escherichia coli]